MMTLKSLAALAGTSITSVSRVINHQTGVNPEVRARVEALVAAHDFRPNLLARELLSRRTRLVGILLPSIQSYYAGRIAGVTDVCRTRKYATLIASANGDLEEEIESFLLFAEKQVEGIVFFAGSLEPRHREVLSWLGRRVPVVCVGQETDDLPVTSLVCDNFGGARLALDHLAALGHRRVAHVGGPSSHLSARQRALAYTRASEEGAWAPPAAWVREGDFSLPSGHRETLALLDAGAGVPTAVFYGNDMMAVGGIRALSQRGLAVPADVSVVGFDDIPDSAYSIPPLTTVHQDHYDIGREAGELLLARVDAGDAPVRKVVLGQSLTVRESTAIPRN